MNSKEFRAELTKIMPGFDWTIHRADVEGFLDATGTQSGGFNRLATLYVARRETPARPDRSLPARTEYTAKSSGYGTKSPWLGSGVGLTLAQALRDLQNAYEYKANTFRSAASTLENARAKKHKAVTTEGSDNG